MAILVFSLVAVPNIGLCHLQRNYPLPHFSQEEIPITHSYTPSMARYTCYRTLFARANSSCGRIISLSPCRRPNKRIKNIKTEGMVFGSYSSLLVVTKAIIHTLRCTIRLVKYKIDADKETIALPILYRPVYILALFSHTIITYALS